MQSQDLPPLHQLETFLAVLDSGGFDAGAKALGISAPAVSQRVRALEAALGRSLLQRTVPVEPTAAGERLLPYARRLVALASDAAVSARGSATESGPPALSLAVNADSLSTWFMEALAAYPRAGEVTFRIERADENLTAQALAAGRVAGAVTTQAEAAAACVAHPLGALRYLPVAAPAFLTRHELRPGTSGTGGATSRGASRRLRPRRPASA